MSLTVEVQRTRKGDATGLVVSAGKKKEKLKTMSASVLVEVSADSLVVTPFDEPGTATRQVELMVKNVKKNPAKFLRSPDRTVALELDGDDYKETASFEQKEAQRLYAIQVQVEQAFRVNLKKQNG